MNRTTARLAAIGGAGALFLLHASPALAADSPAAQADATALTLSLAGQGADSGIVTATHDGTRSKVTGRTDPPVSVLNNQALANIGVLAQSADASVNAAGRGTSRACAGVAGDGGQIVEVGDTACVTPGKAVQLGVGNLDLTGTVLVNPTSALAPLAALQPVIDQVAGPLTKAVTDALAPLESGVITIDLGAVSSWCTASAGGTTSGNSSVVDASVNLEFAGKKITLVKLPVSTDPNTDVLVNLDHVANAVLDGVEVEINEALDGQLKPLQMILDPIRDNVVNMLLAQIAPQLEPLSDNVLKVTLNEQTPGEGSLAVTALRAEVLPAAKQFVGSALVDLSLARVNCGPNATLTKTVTDPTDDPTKAPGDQPGDDPSDPGKDPSKEPSKEPQTPGEQPNGDPKGDVPVTVAAGVAGDESHALRNALMAGGIGLVGLVGLGSLAASARRQRH